MKLAKLAVLLLVLSTVPSAVAYRGSPSTGRSHSRSSSHVRISETGHRSRRATFSAISRNRHGRIKRSASAKHAFERQHHPCPSTLGSAASPTGMRTSVRFYNRFCAMHERIRFIDHQGWSAVERTRLRTCSGRRLRRARLRTRQREIADGSESNCV